MRKKIHHLVARTIAGQRPFLTREISCKFWNDLRGAFTNNTLACVLMPNHLHLLIETANIQKSRIRLGRIMSGLTRHLGRSQLWQGQPRESTPIGPDDQKLRRVIRYIHLNPCRAGLIQDPWRWEFTTLRDHTHQSLNPWIRREVMETHLGGNWSQDKYLELDSTVDISKRHLQKFDNLEPQEIARAISSMNHAPLNELTQRGPNRDFYARALMCSPRWRKTLLETSRDIGIARARLGKLRAQGLSGREVLAIERHQDLMCGLMPPRK